MSRHDVAMDALERDLLSRPAQPPPKKPVPAAEAAAMMGLSGVPAGGGEHEQAPAPSDSRKRKAPEGEQAVSNDAKKIMLRKEKKLAANGHASRRDENAQAMHYMRVLQEGAQNVKGIMAVKDGHGDPIIPYSHQRQAVRRCAPNSVHFMLLAHDAGTGKTATFFQLLAALELMVGGGARTIITVPPSTLDQWEETAHTWLNLKHKGICIVATQKKSLLDASLLKRVRVLIITRHALAALYKQCWEWKPKCEGQKHGMWARKIDPDTGGVVPLTQFWKERWDLLGIDEAHYMRNPDTEWCVAHHQLAMGTVDGGSREGGCRKRIALTATPVFNKPLDMVGLCKAMGASAEFLNKRHWSLDKQCKTINPHTVTAFHKYTDRVKDDMLGLPAIVQETHSFDAGLGADDAVQYNDYLDQAKRLRIALESQGKPSKQDVTRLMLLLQKMQQMMVSPDLARLTAAHFKKFPNEVDRAAERSTGALNALHVRIMALQAQGHARIIVACNHVELMKIARQYLANQSRLLSRAQDVGEIFMYDGRLQLPQRRAVKADFMSASKSVMFLSVGAGGTGLHLVPSSPEGREEREFCRAMIFWGSRPYSPQQVWQTLKRIHRIGQRFECHIHHMIAYGSVDYAINCVHEDKSGLANAIVDDDWSNCDQLGGNWRLKGRIVDMCCPLGADGKFPTQLPGVIVPPAHHAAFSSSIAVPAGLQPVAPLHSKFFRAPLQHAGGSSDGGSGGGSGGSDPVGREIGLTDKEKRTLFELGLFGSNSDVRRWEEAVDKIKAARRGAYPHDWYAQVNKGELFANPPAADPPQAFGPAAIVLGHEPPPAEDEPGAKRQRVVIQIE